MPLTRFFLKKLSRLMINIDQLFLLGILGAFLSLLLGYSDGLYYSLVSIVVLSLIVIIFPTGQWLAVFLENRFPLLKELPDNLTGIIVLGTGFDFQISAARQQICYGPNIGRLLDFIKLVKQAPPIRLIFTGGGRFEDFKVESKFAKELFETAGLNAAPIEFETEARNTTENAAFSYQMVKPKSSEKWLLVTSAFHMPRSVGLFRNLDWHIIPYPVDYHTTGKPKYFNVSLSYAFNYWRLSVHELTEMLINYLSGDSPELIATEEQPL